MCCPEQLISLITAAAAILAKGRSAQEISLLGVIFAQLGDTLSTIAVQKEICESICGNNGLPPESP